MRFALLAYVYTLRLIMKSWAPSLAVLVFLLSPRGTSQPTQNKINKNVIKKKVHRTKPLVSQAAPRTSVSLCSPRSLEVCVQPEGVVCGPRHDPHPLVLPNTLLKEVGLPLQGDVLHEVEGVLHFVNLAEPELHHQPVRHKLNVLLHHVTVHPDQFHRQRLGQKLLLNGHSIHDEC